MIFHPHYTLQVHELVECTNRPSTLFFSGDDLEKLTQCYQYLSQKIKDNSTPYYGINTGFGSLCNTPIPPHQLQELQENLLRSHACGFGSETPERIVRLMLLLKITSLCKGHSGVQPSTVQRLLDFFNHGVIPIVYDQGSLGASGDLAPLAHLCLPLIGEGVVKYKGDIYPASEVLKTLQLEPVVLQPKEGLALINGTQFMSAYAVDAIYELMELYAWANHIAALSAEAYGCSQSPFEELSHRIRPHRGQLHAAGDIFRLRQKSTLRNGGQTQVQDPYCFRCIPQVHGSSADAFAYALGVITTEINSVTDNPNIFPEEDRIISAGNFHGQPLALILDFLAIAASELASISERRTYKLQEGQRGLPVYLIENAGLQSGFMIAQYTAASIVSQNKQWCTPASIDSIVSSNGQEDHVSMGANAATKLYRVVQNVKTVLAIELICACQALDFKNASLTSPELYELFCSFRKGVPFRKKDGIIHEDMQKAVRFLAENPLPKTTYSEFFTP
jgi:histidine ammonia-lyase